MYSHGEIESGPFYDGTAGEEAKVSDALRSVYRRHRHNMMTMGGRARPTLGDIREVMAKRQQSEESIATTMGRGGSDMPYSSMRATASSRPKSLDSLIATIPCSPASRGSPSASPIKEEAPQGNDEPAQTVVLCNEGQHCNSPNLNDTQPQREGAAVVEFDSDEEVNLVDTVRTKPYQNNKKAALPPVIEDQSPGANDDTAGGAGWVGIFGGEAIAVSVGTVSPDLSEEDNGAGSGHPPANDHRPIPRAIDFYSPVQLPFTDSVVPEAEPSLEQGLATKLQQDVDELSIDLSVLGDVDSIASVMTKDEAVDLAKRLGKIERKLLAMAGESGRMDALRALAMATQEQTKRADALEKKVRKQKKKISTLNDLCQRLSDGRKRDRALREKAQKEVEQLKASTADLSLRLCRSEEHNEIMATKLAQMEKENVQNASLRSNRKHKKEMKAKYDKLRKEARRRAEEDRATIRGLESKMTAMAEVYAKKEKRSLDKVKILLEMKVALEEQIRLLEGGEDDDSTA